jgi:hypothetical protein
MLDAVIEKSDTLILFDSPWWLHLWSWAGSHIFVHWPLARFYQKFMCTYWDKLERYENTGVTISIGDEQNREFQRKVWKLRESLLP